MSGICGLGMRLECQTGICGLGMRLECYMTMPKLPLRMVFIFYPDLSKDGYNTGGGGRGRD